MALLLEGWGGWRGSYSDIRRQGGRDDSERKGGSEGQGCT